MSLCRPFLFAASFFLIFALGLLIGGDRLWATDESELSPCAGSAEARLPALFAFFCGAAEPQRVREVDPRNEARQSAGQVRERTVRHAGEPRRAGAWPARDANGNVLQQQGRYMQAVYVAFSPEDTGG